MTLMQWCDGTLAGADRMHTPLTSHALHYGTGVFEGLRAYATPQGAAVFRLEAHLDRLMRGAELLGMRCDRGALADAILETLRANGQTEAYIRPLVWLGTGGLGLDLEPLSCHAMVATLPWSSHLGSQEVSLTVSPHQRIPAKAAPPLKLCGNYVNAILAKREAASRGFGEALFVDAAGMVVECTGENVFLVKHGVVTAVAHPDALPGITRDTVQALTGAKARPVALWELLEADEIFLTGTSAEVVQVTTLDQRVLPSAKIGREVAQHYAAVVRGRAETQRGWLTPV